MFVSAGRDDYIQSYEAVTQIEGKRGIMPVILYSGLFGLYFKNGFIMYSYIMFFIAHI